MDNIARFEITAVDESRRAMEGFKNLASANSVGAQLRNTLIAAFSVRGDTSDAYLNLRNRLTALWLCTIGRRRS